MRRWLGRQWPLALGVCLAACATTSPEVTRLERRIRELEDEVYLLRKSREDLEARLGERPGAQVRTPATSGRDLPPPGSVAVERLDTASPGAGARGASPDRLADAELALERGQHREAIALYAEFLERQPRDPRRGQAQFGLAEAYYADANFPQAIIEYDKVVKSDPAGSLAPDALYKIALCYYELGYEQNAREHLERLIQGYPQAHAAGAAKPLYSKLKGRR